MSEQPIPFDFASQRIIRVEVSSPGKTRDGRPYYVVETITAEGERCRDYDDEDKARAFKIADDCAVGGVPVVDLVNVSPTQH